MDSSGKFLAFGVIVLVIGMTNFNSPNGLIGVNGDLTGYNCCDRTFEDIQASGWDSCTTIGFFKSKSKCYQNTATKQFIYRYDYYQCNRFGSSLTLIQHNCTQEPVPYLDEKMKFDVFNRYSGVSCSLTPPPPPPKPAQTRQDEDEEDI